jgi:hypothetical protein
MVTASPIRLLAWGLVLGQAVVSSTSLPTPASGPNASAINTKESRAEVDLLHAGEPGEMEESKPALHANFATVDIEEARTVVAAAIESAGALNRERLANPLREQTRASPEVASSKRAKGSDKHRLFQLTPEVAAAAALVAEADSFDHIQSNPGSRRSLQIQEGTFWMEHIDQTRGSWPWGNNTDFKVRLVTLTMHDS